MKTKKVITAILIVVCMVLTCSEPTSESVRATVIHSLLVVSGWGILAITSSIRVR